MKIYLNQEEQTYLHNMIASSVEQLSGTVKTYEKLKMIESKIRPPRNYMDLSQDERASLYGVVATGLKAVVDLAANSRPETPIDRKDHLNKVQDLLKTIQIKLEGHQNDPA